MPITEQDAIDALELSKQYPDREDIAQTSAKLLKAYKSQQEGLSQPLFPEMRRREVEDYSKVRGYFTEKDTHGLDDDARKAVFSDLPNEEDRAAMFSEELLARYYGRPAKEVRRLGTQYRDQYAIEKWGEPVKTYKEFFDKQRGEFELENEGSIKAQQLAMSGSPMHEVEAALDFDYVEDPRYKGREKMWREQFRGAYQNVKSQLAGLEPTARVFVDQLKNQMGVGEGAGQAALPDQWFLETVMGIPKEKRDIFLAAVAARAGEGEAKTLFQAMAERMGRTSTEIVRASNATARLTKLDQLARHVAVNGAVSGLPDEFGFSPDEHLTGYLVSREAADRADKSKVPAIGSDEFKALSPEQQTELERIEEEREFVLLYKKVNDIATGAIDPAKGSNYYASGLIGVAGMLPNLGLMAMGPAGMAVNARGYISQRTLDHAAANPGVDTRDSIAIGTAQGIGETMLDVIPWKVLSGRTPLLAKWLKKPTLTRSGIIGRGAARLTGGTILEGATEFGQEVIVPSAVEELAQILKAELPEANWDARLAGFTSEESLSEIIPSIVMLSFLGVGVGSIRDYKGGWQLVGNRDLLIGAKLTEAEADAVVEAARREDAETAQDLLRKAFVRIDEKRDITGVMPEAARTALKNVQAEVEARIIAEEKGEASGIIPKYGRNTDGQHYLRFQDGTTRTYGTAAEASQARWDYAEEKRIDELSEFRSAITMSERGALPGQEFDFEFENRKDDLQQAKARGEVSEAGVQNRLNQANRLDGQATTEQEVTQDPDPTETDIENEYQKKWTAAELQATRLDDQAAAAQILGSSRIEYVGEVTRFVIRLKQGATPLTVFEEKIEGDAKVTLKKKGGRDWMLTRLRDYERFSGDVMLPESDADVTTKDLVEAWSHFGISYLTGKTRKSERGEGYEDVGRAGIQRMMANAKRAGLAVAGEGYTEFFRAVLKRAAKINKMRREGKLDVDMEREIARSLGITEQFQYEQKATEEGQKFKQEIDPDGVLNEEGETSFSVMASQDAEYLNLAKDPEANQARLQEMVDEAGGWVGMAGADPRVSEDPESLWKEYETKNYGEKYSSDYMDIFETKNGGFALSMSKTYPYVEWSRSTAAGRGRTAYLELLYAAKTVGKKGVETQSVAEPKAIGAWKSLERRGLISLKESSTEDRGEDGVYTVFEATILPKGEAFIRGETAPVTYDESGQVIPLSQRFNPERDETTFSVISNAQDAEYLNLAADPVKNQSRLQEMADEVARRAGYTVKAWHGTPEGGFVTFNTRRNSYRKGAGNTGDPNTFLGAHFAEEESVARRFMDELYGAENSPTNPKLYGVYLKISNPLGGDSIIPGDVVETKRVAEANRATLKAARNTLNAATEDLKNKEFAADIKGDLGLISQGKISEWVASKDSESRELFPEEHEKIDRIKQEIERLRGSFGSTKEIKTPNGKSLFLSGDRGLVSEDSFGLESLSDEATGRNPAAESSASEDKRWRTAIGRSMRKNFDEMGFDAAIYENAVEGGISIIIPNPNQIKSADPVTYDESGNIIPLSERFNPEIDSISYSVLLSSLSEYEGWNTLEVSNEGRVHSPIVRDLLQRRDNGEDIPRELIDEAIRAFFPSRLVDVPESPEDLPKREQIDEAILKTKGEKVLARVIPKSAITPGEEVTMRQDVPSMTKFQLGVVTIVGKTGTAYEAMGKILKPVFNLNEKATLKIGLGFGKQPHIKITGEWAEDQTIPADLKDWTQVGFNPDRHSFYYERATMRQVTGGSEAFQIGNTVFVKDPVFGGGNISEISYSVITNAESRIAESFNPFLRNPEKRLKIVLEAQRRAAEKARGFQEIIRLNRSGADIERERLTREADLMGEKLDTLSPSEIGALEAMGTGQRSSQQCGHWMR
jgi:hypothetical protein